jgi:hypothetical protein
MLQESAPDTKKLLISYYYLESNITYVLDELFSALKGIGKWRKTGAFSRKKFVRLSL